MGGRPGKLALPKNYGVEEWREQRKDCGRMAKLITLRMHSFGVYEALMVAAAFEAGCAILHSEDFQDGITID